MCDEQQIVDKYQTITANMLSQYSKHWSALLKTHDEHIIRVAYRNAVEAAVLMELPNIPTNYPDGIPITSCKPPRLKITK